MNELIGPGPDTSHRTPVGPLACVERYQDTVTLAGGPVRLIRGAWEWSRLWQPEHYTFNLRPGLPLNLAHRFMEKGVPCTAIVADGQLRQDSPILNLLHETFDRCEGIVVASPEVRDQEVRRRGTVITWEHIMSKACPTD